MCQSQDLSAAQVIRELMRNYLSNQKNRDQLDIFLEKQETSHMVDIEKKLPSTNVSDKER